MVRFVPHSGPKPLTGPCPGEHPTEEELALEYMEFQMSNDPEKIFLPYNPMLVAWEMENNIPTSFSVNYSNQIYMQFQELKKTSVAEYGYCHIKPRPENPLIWDCLIDGQLGTVHAGAWYYGYFQFSGKGGFRPPLFTLVTPTGRYPSKCEKHFIPEGEWKWNTHASELIDGLKDLVLRECPMMAKHCNHLMNCRRKANESIYFNQKNKSLLSRARGYCGMWKAIGDMKRSVRHDYKVMGFEGNEEEFPVKASRKRKMMDELEGCPMQKVIRFMEAGYDCNCADNVPICLLRHLDYCIYNENNFNQ